MSSPTSKLAVPIRSVNQSEAELCTQETPELWYMVPGVNKSVFQSLTKTNSMVSKVRKWTSDSSKSEHEVEEQR